jgi:hypothetical protein
MLVPLVVFLFAAAFWIFVLVVLWRLMKANESTAASLQAIAEKRSDTQ